MLTASELVWLNEREIILACEGCYIWDAYWEDGVELKTMQEAAEFEQKVTVALALRCAALEKILQHITHTAEFKDIGTAAENILMKSRLAIEEEMNGKV